MTAKEYLRQTYRMNEQMNSYLQEIEELRELSMRISGSNFNECITHTKSTEPQFIQCIDKLVDMEHDLACKIDHLIALKAKISTAIDNLSNPKEEILLRYRYINHYSWEKIRMLMNVSNRTVHRIHSNALKNFIVPY